MMEPDRDIELGAVPDQYLQRPKTWRRKPTEALRTLTTIEEDLLARLPPLSEEECRVKDALIACIVGDQIIKRSLATASTWYARYLQCKFNSNWHLLATVLVGLDDHSAAPRPGDLVVVFKYVKFVAKLLKGRQDLCLVDVVDEMDNKGIMKLQLDSERAKSNQLAFATIGWLTMLYEAVPYPRPDKLEVTKTSTSSSGERNKIVTRKYDVFQQGFDHIDAPLFDLLGVFGKKLIPGPRLQYLSDTNDQISMQSVCFSSLQQYAGISIEWVSSLALHLEFDSGRKTLKVFQFPSFCRMMSVEKRDNLLSRLLDDHAATHCEDVAAPDIPTEEYFEEIMRTYRLLFGQDERSWRAFASQVPRLADQALEASAMWACDPLLYVLCGTSCASEEAKQVYHDLDSSPEGLNYDPSRDFPFFGKRLMELQQLVKQHQPQNLKALMTDRRDVAAWLNVWSTQLIVFFTTFTIFLVIVGLILQGWQIWLATQQLKQGDRTA